MTVRRVLVIGAGAAGASAAIAASRAGAEVTIADGGPASSALMSGAVDLLPWERADSLSAALPEGALWREALEAFRLWCVSDSRTLLASTAGCLRSSRGRDRALLDLEPLRGGRVAVPRTGRTSFDAALLVRGWNADPLANSLGLRFHLIDCEGLLSPGELALSDTDLARGFDELERVRAAAALLREAAAGFAAVLLGPWLGVETDAAAALGRAIGMPVGETLSMLSGPAGARFERRRDLVLASLGARRIEGAVASLERPRAWRARLQDGAVVEADAVVVAVGGMIGGGITLAPAESEESDEFPAAPRPPFVLSVQCDDLHMRTGAVRVEVPGSLQGPNLEEYAWPVVPEQRAVFERVGIAHDALRAVDSTGRAVCGCFVAGAAAADLPHTVLAAIDSGARAGALASSG